MVLFFYPAAMTSGCTKESCHFRDLAAEFDAVGAQRVGISADAVDKQRQFSEKHGFDYPLLSDVDRSVAEAFGVKRGGISITPVKRSTFVIDTDRKVLSVIKSEVNMNKHADAALEVLEPASLTPAFRRADLRSGEIRTQNEFVAASAAADEARPSTMAAARAVTCSAVPSWVNTNTRRSAIASITRRGHVVGGHARPARGSGTAARGSS